jgi:glycosyltransferase involved in cell wall biosynthesis
MRVLVTAPAHFAMTPDGALWVDNAGIGYAIWARYLDVFDEVSLLTRAYPTPRPPDGWNTATGPGVKAAPVTDFLGAWGFARQYRNIAPVIRDLTVKAEAVLLRVPCHLGREVWRRLPDGRPYGVEVVSDPYDAFAPGAISHPLRAVFRWWFPRSLRRQCADACAAAYVTQGALQRRYPPAPDAFASFYSDVQLRDDSFVSAPRTFAATPGCNLVFVGSLAQLYKAPDVLIDAVAACVRQGLNVELHIVGDGRHRPELRARAAARQLDGRITFRGQLPAVEMVRAELDWADVFILPSKTEGMPRAMIEAMARALPCIGSTAGGIPELLPPEDMVPPGDMSALARKIREVVTAPERMAVMSSRNLATARQFRSDVLRSRRVSLYEHLRSRTWRWLQGHAA